jgi:hypothetical protein
VSGHEHRRSPRRPPTVGNHVDPGAGFLVDIARNSRPDKVAVNVARALTCRYVLVGDDLYWIGAWPTTTFVPAGPLVAAIVVIAVAAGGAGFRDLGARIVRRRVPWYWYAVALGLPLAVRIGSVLVNTGAGGAPAPDWTTLAWTSFGLAVLVRLVNPMDGPFGEEPGWRGMPSRGCRRRGRRCPRR